MSQVIDNIRYSDDLETVVGVGNFYEITTAVIKEGVTKIKECAFSLCKKLESIEILSSVTTIGEYSFEVCEQLYFIIFMVKL